MILQKAEVWGVNQMTSRGVGTNKDGTSVTSVRDALGLVFKAQDG